MAANSSHHEGVTTPSEALHELFTTHPALTPEATGLTWSLTPAGGLLAEARDATDGGLALRTCAEILGGDGHVATVLNGQERVCLGELAAVWRGLPVQVWETWTSLEPRLPLGAVAVLPAGGGAR
jgi:hypothetical protein